MNNFDSMVDMVTITIYVQEVKEYTKPPIEAETMGEKIREGFLDSLASVMGFLQDLVVFVICFIPYLIILVPLVLIIRGILKRRKASKIKKQEEYLRQRRSQLEKEIKLEHLKKQEDQVEADKVEKQKEVKDEK